MSRLSAVRRRLSNLLVSASALVIVAAALWTTVGVASIGITALVALVWLLASTPYAVAVGGLLSAILASGSGLVDALAVGSLLALFVADLVIEWPARTSAVGIVVLLPSAAALAAIWRAEPLWAGAVVLLGGFALLAYAFHRYELVRLGLLGEAEA
ncbi:hypothetical protein HWV23_15395 [Natronomonas halophila]|uniref:hypothetical protein n=1 Tax=Natronomonas halophila TaxID=2747817 RepID=UPI0015B5A7EB|nr:hypothetical protein [Natronomonas halophila]QLD87048.1 hypothetical protein HWV23_15395 [Natronomonas halophila]